MSITINPLLAARRSPRAFDDQPLLKHDINTIMEAARWAPSASNTQPWRFIMVGRNEPDYKKLIDTLAQGNRIWAERAPLLVVAFAQLTNTTGDRQRWAEYDLGQAVAHLTIQAQDLGYHTHQMGGFDATLLKEHFNITPDLEPLTVIAVGRLGDLTTLPNTHQERERAPRTRLPLDELLLQN